ncbi:MAG: NAD-dependent epimerase/dehydratase family protein [Bacteroidetes bacterium]|nr:NAD-dependent epimerase/dehydratase family protein [Bacteroidota bacterium]
MKNVIITGGSGMIGGLILKDCLERNDVAKVTSLVRRGSGIVHPKLMEVIHDDFLNYTAVESHFKNQDVCFFCIGVYTGQVPTDEFVKITVDYTKAFAETLKQQSPNAVFCFLSGSGADPKEKSRILFAREKGKAENILLGLKFKATYIFRPGYIYPVTARKEPNLSYRLFRVLYRYIFKWALTAIGITSEQLAYVIEETGINGGSKVIYENAEMRKLAGDI